MVRLRDTRSERRLVDDYGLRVEDRFQPQGDLLHVRIQSDEDLARLQADSRVLYAEPNYCYSLDEVSQQPQAQWALPKVQAETAWQMVPDGPSPIVAVLDTGVDCQHPALTGNMWVNVGEIPGDGIDNDGNGVIDDVNGYNANADTGDCGDAYGHGTHVAGILGANGEVKGVNPRARIMAIRIHDQYGSTNAAAIARGLRYAQQMGATITNNSWGGPKAAYSIRDSFAAFPALHVMSAGNAGKNNDFHAHYPGNFDIPNKLVVAASDRNDGKPSFSNYGKGHVDLAAPGEDIYSTLKDGQFGPKSGTSMAAPLVAGVASLVATAHPDWSPAQLRAAILGGADVLPQWQGTVASGARLNAVGALSQPPTPAPPR